MASAFITTPYLPRARVTLAVGGFAPEGIALLPTAKLTALPPALRRHADLGLCPIGGAEVVCPPDSYAFYADMLSPYGFSVICGGQALGRSYPADTAYNVVVAGKFALLNPRVCDKILFKLLENRFEIIPVKQGYAKCSVCPVDENSVITADRGIARAAEKRGLEALEIKNDGVMLPPYKSGFFGGAAGLVGRSTLAVNGSLSHMESGNDILKFLHSRSVEALEIHGGAPFDTGSLIPLMTEANNIQVSDSD